MSEQGDNVPLERRLGWQAQGLRRVGAVELAGLLDAAAGAIEAMRVALEAREALKRHYGAATRPEWAASWGALRRLGFRGDYAQEAVDWVDEVCAAALERAGKGE